MHGLKDNYDFAFSIGGACACSQTLRRAGMQFASFPLDWVGKYPSVTFVAELISKDFAGLLVREKMIDCGPNPDNDMEIYRNGETGIYFLHDFRKGGNFELDYPIIEEKYRRRAERFAAFMKRSGRVLAVYVSVPNREEPKAADLLSARDLIALKYPDAEVDLLWFSQLKDVAFEPSNIERLNNHVFRAAFDFQAAHAPNIADDKVLAPVLRSLVKSVRDYRTAEQKAGYKIAARQKKYALYKAKSFWQYQRNKFYYKLFKHFKNRLERSGFKF